MKPALEYLLSILMTYLPPRYRAEAAKLRGPAMTAGILQCGLAMGYLLYRFYISQRPTGSCDRPLQAVIGCKLSVGCYPMTDALVS
jgi:hypothetical protein